MNNTVDSYILKNIKDFSLKIDFRESCIIALDVSANNVGVAISPKETIIAVPCIVYSRVNMRKDIWSIMSLIKEKEADAIIVGKSIDLDGNNNSCMNIINSFVHKLIKKMIYNNIKIPFYMHDERFTTNIASFYLQSISIKKLKYDDLAATVLLQEILDLLRIGNY